MNGFPQEFPGQAVNQILAFISHKDTDKGRLALAAYELVGFGLGKAFGDPKYLMQDSPAFTAITSDQANALTSLTADQIATAGIPDWLVPLIIAAIKVAMEKWLLK